MSNHADFDVPQDVARYRVLDEPTAARFIGLSASSLERIRKAGSAPRHLCLSERRIGYRVCDLLVWLDTRAGEIGGEH